MKTLNLLTDLNLFCSELHSKMLLVAPVCQRMEPYEFRYSLNNITPAEGDWSVVSLRSPIEIQKMIRSKAYFEKIEIKPRVNGKIVLDRTIMDLTQMLFVGLVTGSYAVDWVKELFYFDPRGFNFFVRSTYMTDEIRIHLGETPFQSFEKKQRAFEQVHEVGYQEFKQANAEVDQAFIDILLNLVKNENSPMLLAIAGPTAAGKTEIVDRLRDAFAAGNQKITSLELDNFLLDRDYREEKDIGSFGKQALHFKLLVNSIHDLLSGNTVFTPRYDFISAFSSHDLEGNVKPDGKPVRVDPADIVFIEGNSPFLLPEIAQLVKFKVVYLTDDPVRLKRKWRRDIDYRKKYDPYYLRNRFFKEQPLMAWINYQPQLNLCDIFVDTTNAEVWVTPEIATLLS